MSPVIFRHPAEEVVNYSLAVFSYFTGLAKLFPKTKVFTGYQLNHLDNNVIVSEVSGVSGSWPVIKMEI